LTANLVVGADGRRSTVAKSAGIHAKERPNNRFAYWAYFRDVELASAPRATTWFLNPDLAYAIPCEDGLTLMLVMIPKRGGRLQRFRHDIEGEFHRFWAQVPEAPTVGAVQREGKFQCILSMSNLRRVPQRRGLALVGDAAMSSDPLFGVGCGFAFQSAEWLVDLTSEHLGDAVALDNALHQYAKRHSQELAGHHATTSSYSTGRPFIWVEKVLYGAAARDRKMMHIMAAIDARYLSPFSVPRRVLARGALIYATRFARRRLMPTFGAYPFEWDPWKSKRIQPRSS
jgi:2-polyprenyl-6-methoxyphenol hydroxylase-like FAD-dependent oxidoreductase